MSALPPLLSWAHPLTPDALAALSDEQLLAHWQAVTGLHEVRRKASEPERRAAWRDWVMPCVREMQRRHEP